MSSDVLCPLSFETAPSSAGTAEYLEDPSIRLLAAFFQRKGLAALKEEDRREDWYQDWIDYQAKHGLYASVLSPARYSSLGNRFNLLKLARFLEVFAYFSPAHAYSIHVSFLGLFPILMSANESLKREAIAKLEAGGLFAFAVSERAHGADLMANEFAMRQAGSGDWVGDGAKYYIGNANAACLISVLAKEGTEAAGTSRRAPFAFFALRPREAPAFQNVRKIGTLGVRSAFVGEFEVRGHRFPESDVISRGREAWNAIFGTVNFGKFFLGLGSVGICAHAFAEAIDHMYRRDLYGKPVTAMPHIRAATAFAFARLTAMKLYAYRALDYIQASCDDDKRYLLFNAVQKAKVSTEGLKVLALLSECIGARGFESETYFEGALREAQLVPGLEGSTHINFALTVQFIAGYFAASDEARPAPGSVALSEAGAEESESWFRARDRNPRTARFLPFLQAYRPFRSQPNVRLFAKQAKAFRRFAKGGLSAEGLSADHGLVVAAGKCFSTIAYAQLVAENCGKALTPPSVVSLIFHGLIQDLGEESLKLAAMFPARSTERGMLKRVVRVPVTCVSDLESVSELIAGRYGTYKAPPAAS